MSPQLAEAQQPPAIVERADRFANPSPLQPVKTDFRTEFVADAVEGSPAAPTTQRRVSSPAVEKLLQDRPPRPDVYDPAHPEAFDPGSLVITPGMSEYRGQTYSTHAMIPTGHHASGNLRPEEIRSIFNYVPLNEAQIQAQKTGIDARLAGHFSAEDAQELQALSRASERLVGQSMHAKALEYQLGQRDFSNPSDVMVLGGLQRHFAEVAKEPNSDALKLELQTVADKFGRAYQRGMNHHGKSADEEFTRLYTDALDELGHLREKIGDELLGNMDRVKGISARAVARHETPPPEASTEAANHIQRLASCIVGHVAADQFSGEQLARQIGKL